jgi:hypothetical protein
MPSIPFYCRWLFAPILVGASTCFGLFWFAALHVFEPVDVLDIAFYLSLYAGIGAIVGLAAWYFARLVARNRASWFTIAALLFPAYLLVAFLGLNKNIAVAILATISVGFILLLSLSAARSNRESRPA